MKPAETSVSVPLSTFAPDKAVFATVAYNTTSGPTPGGIQRNGRGAEPGRTGRYDAAFAIFSAR